MTPFGTTGSPDGGGIAKETRSVEVTAQYQFDFGLWPTLSHCRQKFSP